MGIGALCVAVLVDRRLLKYEDLVTKYWPQFGQHGKDNVTVSMLVSHQAGVPNIFGYDVDENTIRDRNKMGEILADQKPMWPPGTAHGYHAITQGFLVDQLLLRVDPRGRRS
ncbi:PREDICTED: beta-lactamase domain-containing protein 2-like [Priapulus caudatus]|uniref:Beta-lactamase domain-containing protein 2-like n=1 Tax=Priapulus caudatus TaxID=37621 RepID=A0ABM1FA28_PRICU|nr:PREDICTED: beta-lactamase domain-containing protein 2-like [Priapulus caudatus]